MTVVDTETGEIPATVNYDIHPIASCYPLIQGDEFRALVESIRVSGQRVPVVLDKHGRLLDGRNRARACQALGIDVLETTYWGDDVQQYVLDLNEHRRHMDIGARTLVAAKMANLAHGGDRKGEKFKGPTGLLIEEPPISNDEAAKALDVSPTQVKRARRILRDAPDLIPAIEAGDLPIRAAENILRAEPDDEAKRVVLVSDHKAGKSTPPPKKVGPKSPPKYGGNRKKNLAVIDSIATAASGLAIAADEITFLDQSVTCEEAARLADDLSQSIRSLNRIKTLLKERTS